MRHNVRVPKKIGLLDLKPLVKIEFLRPTVVTEYVPKNDPVAVYIITLIGVIGGIAYLVW